MLAAMAQSRRAAITWRTNSGELAHHHHVLVQATFNTVSGPQNCTMCAMTQVGSSTPVRGILVLMMMMMIMVQVDLASCVFILAQEFCVRAKCRQRKNQQTTTQTDIVWAMEGFQKCLHPLKVLACSPGPLSGASPFADNGCDYR